VTFGALIARACRDQDVTRYELSKRLRVAPSRALQIVKSRNLTERVLRDCARALGLEVECRLVRRKK
jgi:hypothetical protein